MIVRATSPLMPGARLTPARRTYTGPRRGLGLVHGGANYRRRGLGDAASTLSLALANINRDSSSYLNNLGYSVEQGQVVSPEMMVQGLRDRVAGVCTDVLATGNACDPHALDSQVAALGDQYAKALADKQASIAALVAAGAIAVPAGYYGGQNLYQQNYVPPTLAQANANLAAVTAAPPPPPPPPVASVPVVNAPAAVQSNAPAASVAPIPTSSPAPAQSNASTPAIVVPGIASVSSFLTESAFLGIPNWALGAGAIAVGFALFGGGRR